MTDNNGTHTALSSLATADLWESLSQLESDTLFQIWQNEPYNPNEHMRSLTFIEMLDMITIWMLVRYEAETKRNNGKAPRAINVNTSILFES
ncbi:MAG: hypothetical protein ACYDHO_06495 [Gaiellaceae bacterium]